MAAGDRRWSRWAAALLLLLLAALQACARPTGGASGVSPASGTVGSGGILFVSLSLRGHLVPLTRLASALVDRGYQRVAFAVQEDGREYVNKTDAKFISLGRLPYAKAERRERLKQICLDHSLLRGSLTLLHDIYLPNAAPMYKSLHAIVARDRPSLIIMDTACIAALDVAHHFNIPYILNHPSLPLRLDYDAAADSHAARSTAPRAADDFSWAPSWLERTLHFLHPRLISVVSTSSLMEVNRLRWFHDLPLFHSPSHIFESMPTVREGPRVWTEEDETRERTRRDHAALMDESIIVPQSHSGCRAASRGPEAILVNAALGLEHAYPLPQSVTLTGVLMPPVIERAMRDLPDDADPSTALSAPSPLAAPLPPGLLAWLEQSTKPVVLVLFGAGTMSYLSPLQVKQLSAGLSDSRFRVVWSLRTEGQSAIGASPNSFRIKTNVPQLAAFAHPMVRAVVAPCGSATAHEALYFGKPLLCVPLFGDQSSVSSRVAAAGAGIVIDKWPLEVADISRHALTIVRNHTFHESARRLGRVLRASGGTGLAADIVERTLHRQRYHLLEQPERLQCWHQTYHLDILALACAVLIIAVLVVRCAGMLLAASLAALRARALRHSTLLADTERLVCERTRAIMHTWRQSQQSCMDAVRDLLVGRVGRGLADSAPTGKTVPIDATTRTHDEHEANHSDQTGSGHGMVDEETRHRSDSIESTDSCKSNGHDDGPSRRATRDRQDAQLQH